MFQITRDFQTNYSYKAVGGYWTANYKQAGNSVTVNVIEAIAKELKF